MLKWGPTSLLGDVKKKCIFPPYHRGVDFEDHKEEQIEKSLEEAF